MKDLCISFAKQIYEETGRFPTQKDWKVKFGYPCNVLKIPELFGTWAELRRSCGIELDRGMISSSDDMLLWIQQHCSVDQNGCWNWFRGNNKYGKIVWQGKWYGVHRISFILAKGEIQTGLVIRHKCHNKRCCNPEHLETGSQRENRLDSIGHIKSASANIIHHKKNMTNEELIEWLESITRKYNQCWEYPIVGSEGYAKIYLKTKYYLLHRYVCSIFRNIDYESKWVARHICSNKCCVNPEHIVPGTNRDNGIDSREHSRKTKLNRQIVIDIKNDWIITDLPPMKFYTKWSTLAKVSNDAVRNVIYGKRWSDIQP
jgi:hypothetical protein